MLPRGALGRSRFETGLGLHIGYARKLRGKMELEVYGDIFNVFNDQGVFGVSDRYTSSPTNPILGGSYEDLIFAKANDATSGGETSAPVARDPNFGNVTARYSPLGAQFGARLSF